MAMTVLVKKHGYDCVSWDQRSFTHSHTLFLSLSLSLSVRLKFSSLPPGRLLFPPVYHTLVLLFCATSGSAFVCLSLVLSSVFCGSSVLSCLMLMHHVALPFPSL